MMKPAIIAIAYNRPEALKRLLCSIENAVFPEGDTCELIISVDKSDSDDVVRVANEFVYTHGKKTVLARSERMGLREHVLACGDLTQNYDSIIVLEDDLYVSPHFYGYAVDALTFSEGDDRIGAVSLYNHLFNVHTREPFEAIDDGYDNYYLQIASSWGQAYTAKQWNAFRKWYDRNSNKSLVHPLVPANISGWSDRSWLKYYIVYLIETGKYCLYPRVSMTTNFADEGTHACKQDNDLQVPLAGGNIRRTEFSTLDVSHAVYDPFFEPVGYMENGCVKFAFSDPKIREHEPVLTDLYGSKPVERIVSDLKGNTEIRYVLSSASLPYSRIGGFGRRMRPLEANIVYNVSGDVFHLYDLGKKAAPPAEDKKAAKYLYDHRGISVSKMMEIIKYRIFERFGK